MQEESGKMTAQEYLGQVEQKIISRKKYKLWHKQFERNSDLDWRSGFRRKSPNVKK